MPGKAAGMIVTTGPLANRHIGGTITHITSSYNECNFFDDSVVEYCQRHIDNGWFGPSMCACAFVRIPRIARVVGQVWEGLAGSFAVPPCVVQMLMGTLIRMCAIRPGAIRTIRVRGIASTTIRWK